MTKQDHIVTKTDKDKNITSKGCKATIHQMAHARKYIDPPRKNNGQFSIKFHLVCWNLFEVVFIHPTSKLDKACAGAPLRGLQAVGKGLCVDADCHKVCEDPH